MKKHVVLLVWLVCSLQASAALTLNGLFGDNMVLQRGKPVPVWGTADAEEQVTVEFGGRKKTAQADPGGNWRVDLDALDTSSEPRDLVVSSTNPAETRKIRGVLVGEVWICSGQSNMQRQLGRLWENERPLVNWEAEVASANYPMIRHIAVPREKSDTPRADILGHWDVCSPATAPKFTAVGYYFGRDLFKRLNVPIGLIHTSWGGSPAEAWTPREALEKQLPEILAAQQKEIETYPARLAKFKADEPALLAAWEKAAAEARAAGKKPREKPKAPENPVETHRRPACLYNGMVMPLIPYAMRGVIWYQGEGNSGRAQQYRTLFPLLIAQWRDAWRQGDFPFLFVQLAPYKGNSPGLREAQLMTWKTVPSTAMVVTTDVGDAEDVHPTNKEPVGQRLALAARALVYGEKIEYSGPVFDSMKVNGNSAVLTFSHVGGGLAAKGGDLRGFTIAGTDMKFVPAKAVIRGKTVVVSSEQVPSPVAVRYGWAPVPDVNLVNAEGLPASPFRTDEDSIPAQGKK
jgi:sialate O-acetylesterase